MLSLTTKINFDDSNLGQHWMKSLAAYLTTSCSLSEVVKVADRIRELFIRLRAPGHVTSKQPDILIKRV
nr:hypothetical protein HmN_000807200 [Hymenolepis microstoma]